MATLRIIIQGISLTYQKDGVWKTVFPFGGETDCHKVVFVREKFGQKIPLAGSKGLITVRVKSASSATSAGYDFDNFLDLTNPGYSHSRLAMNAGWDEHAVLMTMESAVLSQYELTKSRWGLKEGSSLKKAFDYVAYSGVAEITAEEIEVSAEGVDGFPIIFGNDETIMIDNTCGQYHFDDNGDLKLLYEYIVHDPDTPGRRFAIVRDPQDEPDFDNDPALMMEPSGAFKPLAKADNPLAGEAGLPCNKFIASNSDGLY